MTDRVLTTPDGGWPPPWPLLLEVARSTHADMWVLVGGLMVQAHALLAGVRPTRVTTDVDMLLDFLTRDASTGTVVADLLALGFTPQEPGWPDAPFHRFTRGTDVIDLVVPDHLPSRIQARVLRRPVMAVDGGAQALERTMTVTLADGDRPVAVVIPDVLGALVFKAAAAMTDRRDNTRHLRDGALLAGLVTDYASERSRMHGHDHKRLCYLAEQLKDPYHPAWVGLSDDLVRRGRDALHFLTLPLTPPARPVRQPQPAAPPER